MNMDDQFDSEFIVVGRGIAGLRAAVDLAEAGRVLILTKAEIADSKSAYAQGGIAAAEAKKNPRSLRCGGRWDGGGNLLTGKKLHEFVEFIQEIAAVFLP